MEKYLWKKYLWKKYLWKSVVLVNLQTVLVIYYYLIIAN